MSKVKHELPTTFLVDGTTACLRKAFDDFKPLLSSHPLNFFLLLMKKKTHRIYNGVQIP